MAGEQIELGARLFVSQDDLNPSILQLIQTLIGANAQMGQFSSTLGQTNAAAQQAASGVNVVAQGVAAAGNTAQQAAQAAANAAQLYQNAAGRWVQANGQFANAAQIQQHLAQQAAAAGQAAQGAAGGVGALGAAAQGAAAGMNAGGAAAAGMAVNISNLNINVRQAGQTAGQAQTAFVSLGGILSGLPGPLGQAANLFGHLTVAIQQNQAMALGLAAVYTGIGAGIASGLAEAVREAGEFQRTFQDVEIVSRATAEQMDAFREKAISLGASSQFSSQQIAQGFYELSSAGLNVREALGAIEPAVTAATLGHSQLKDTTVQLASIMRQFGLDAGDVTRIVDVQTTMVSDSLLHWNQMGDAFRNVQGSAKFMGISLESTAAALEVMANAGTTATMAGTSFRTFLDRIVKGEGSSDEAGRAIAKLGLNLWDLNGAFVGVVPILRQVETATAGMTDRQKDGLIAMLGGARAGALLRDTLNAVKEVQIDGQTVMLRGVDVLQYYEQQNYAAAGASERANEILKTGLLFNVQRLTSSVQEVGIRIGTVLIPALTEIVKVGTDVLAVFINAPQPIQQMVTVFGAAAAAGAILVGVMTTLGIAAPIIGTGFAAATAAMAAVGISAGALAPIILGVATASAALSLAWSTDFANIREHTQDATNAIGQWLTDLREDVDLTAKYLERITIPNLTAPVGGFFDALGTNIQQSGVASAIAAATNNNPEIMAAGGKAAELFATGFLEGLKHLTIFGWIQTAKEQIEGAKPGMQQAIFDTMDPAAQQQYLDERAVGVTDSIVAATLSKVKDGQSVLSAAMFELRAQMVKEGIPNEEIANSWDERFKEVLTRIRAYRPDLVKEGENTAQAVAQGMVAHKQTVEEAANSLMEGAKGNLHKAALEAADAGQQMTAQYLFQQEAMKKLVDSALTPLDAARKAEIATMSSAKGYLETLNFLLANGLVTYKEYQNAIVGVTTAHKEQEAGAKGAAAAEKALKAEMTPGQQVYEAQAQHVVSQVAQGTPIDVRAKLADAGKGKSAQQQLQDIMGASGLDKKFGIADFYYGSPEGINDRIALLAAALTGGAASKLAPAAQAAGANTGHSIVSGAATGIKEGEPTVVAAAGEVGTKAGAELTRTFSLSNKIAEQAGVDIASLGARIAGLLSGGISDSGQANALQEYITNLATGVDPTEAKAILLQKLREAATVEPGALTEPSQEAAQSYTGDLIAALQAKIPEVSAAGVALGTAVTKATADGFSEDDAANAVDLFTNMVRERLVAKTPETEAAAQQAGQVLRDAIASGMSPEDAATLIQNYLGAVETEFPAQTTRTRGVAEQSGRDIAAGMASPLNPGAGQALMTPFFEGIGRAFDEHGGEWQALGASILAGIGQGIQTGLGQIGGVVTGAIDFLVNAAKTKLEAKSPSRVMAEEVGLPMIQGVGAGFLEGLGSVQGVISNSVASLVTGASGELMRGMGQLVKEVDDQVGVEIKKTDPTLAFSPLNMPGQGTAPADTAGFSEIMANWTEKLLNRVEITSYDTSKSGTNMAPVGIGSNAKYKGPGTAIGPINFNYPGDYYGDEGGQEGPATWDPYNQGPATPQDDLIAFSPGGRGGLARGVGGFDLSSLLGMPTSQAAIRSVAETLASEIGVQVTAATGAAMSEVQMPPTGPYTPPFTPTQQVQTGLERHVDNRGNVSWTPAFRSATAEEQAQQTRDVANQRLPDWANPRLSPGEDVIPIDGGPYQGGIPRDAQSPRSPGVSPFWGDYYRQRPNVSGQAGGIEDWQTYIDQRLAAMPQIGPAPGPSLTRAEMIATQNPTVDYSGLPADLRPQPLSATRRYPTAEPVFDEERQATLDAYTEQRRALRESGQTIGDFTTRVAQVDQGIADLGGAFNGYLADFGQTRMTEEEWRGSLAGQGVQVGSSSGTYPPYPDFPRGYVPGNPNATDAEINRYTQAMYYQAVQREGGGVPVGAMHSYEAPFSQGRGPIWSYSSGTGYPVGGQNWLPGPGGGYILPQQAINQGDVNAAITNAGINRYSQLSGSASAQYNIPNQLTPIYQEQFDQLNAGYQSRTNAYQAAEYGAMATGANVQRDPWGTYFPGEPQRYAPLNQAVAANAPYSQLDSLLRMASGNLSLFNKALEVSSRNVDTRSPQYNANLTAQGQYAASLTPLSGVTGSIIQAAERANTTMASIVDQFIECWDATGKIQSVFDQTGRNVTTQFTTLSNDLEGNVQRYQDSLTRADQSTGELADLARDIHLSAAAGATSAADIVSNFQICLDAAGNIRQVFTEAGSDITARFSNLGGDLTANVTDFFEQFWSKAGESIPDNIIDRLVFGNTAQGGAGGIGSALLEGNVNPSDIAYLPQGGVGGVISPAALGVTNPTGINLAALQAIQYLQANNANYGMTAGGGSPQGYVGGKQITSENIGGGINAGSAVDRYGNPLTNQQLVQAAQTTPGSYNPYFGESPADQQAAQKAAQKYAQDIANDAKNTGNMAKALANKVSAAEIAWGGIEQASASIHTSVAGVAGAFAAMPAGGFPDGASAIAAANAAGYKTPGMGNATVNTGGSGPAPTNGNTYGAQSGFALQQLVDQLAARGIQGGDTNFQSELTKLRQTDSEYIRVVGRTTQTLGDYQREMDDAQQEVTNLSNVMNQLGGAYGAGIGIAANLAAAQARLAAATAGAAAATQAPVVQNFAGYTSYTQPGGNSQFQSPTYYTPTGTNIASTIATMPGPNGTTLSGVNQTTGGQQAMVNIQGVLVPAGATSAQSLAILAAHGIFPEMPENPRVFGEGGIAMNRQLAIVGDGGPELIIPIDQLTRGATAGPALTSIAANPALTSTAGTRFGVEGSTLSSIGGNRAFTSRDAPSGGYPTLPVNYVSSGVLTGAGATGFEAGTGGVPGGNPGGLPTLPAPPPLTPYKALGGIGVGADGVTTWNGVPIPGYQITSDGIWLEKNGVRLTDQEAQILATLKGVNLSQAQIYALTGTNPPSPTTTGTTATVSGTPAKNYGPVHLINSTGVWDFYQQPDGSIFQAVHGSGITKDQTGFGYAQRNLPINLSGSLTAQNAIIGPAPSFTANPSSAPAGTRMIRTDDKWDTYIQPDGAIIQVPHGSVPAVDIGGRITWGPPVPTATTPTGPTGPFQPTSVVGGTGSIPTSTTVPTHTVTEPTATYPTGVLPTPTFTGGRVPGFAQGGIAWTPQLAMVAENGPERITPLGSEGAGGGNVSIGDIHIHITSQGDTVADVAEIGRRLRAEWARSGLELRRRGGV